MSASDSNPAASSDSAASDTPTIVVPQPASQGDYFERPGDFIGPYRLMEQVGEGGFGTVWRAEQMKPVHREVALKVIKPGMDSREIIARFEAERQALALMDHPNIARMFEGGTTATGRPYFAMEFVKGEPVNAFCDSRKLPIADRIPIFTDICSAVQHAHQKAILHRDLKPSNIIVTESGGRIVPKVIDFGVAKALGQQLSDKTMFTAIGLAIGTPEYMSPEQAGAGNQDIDTRSDVYSLGVILYELLIGSTPLRRDEVRKLMIHQLMEVLRTQDAERPSTRFQHLEEATRRQVASARHVEFTRLQKHLRGDLDWIVMRALEKDRNRRYQTVNALALDLQRYLKGDPVEAGPPSASYRLGKIARRYRGSLIAASLVLASIFAGLGFTVWQATRARKAEKLASQRFGEAEQARDAAENLISEAVYGLRKKLMAVGKVEVMEEMVAAADGYYRRLPAELYDDDAKRHLASLALNRAIIAEALGQDKEYEKHTRDALRFTEDLAARYPDDEKLQDEVCFAMLNLCYLFMDRNDNTALIPMADATVARCEAWLKRKPGSIWAMRYQVVAHNFAAQATVRFLKKIPEGFARFQTAAQIARRMREVAGETAEVCEAEGLIHYGNANVAGRLNQHDLEISEFEASTASFARALELGGDSALLREMHVGALHHAGETARKRARAKGDAEGEKRGEELVRRAFEGRRKLVELEPGRAEWWRDLAYSHRVLGEIARGKHDVTTEIQHLQEDLRCRDEAVKRQPNRPQLYDERGTTCSVLASTLLNAEAPDPKRSGELTLRSLEDWKRAVEMSGFAPLMRNDIKGEIDRLGKIALSDPSTGLPLLVSARNALQPLVGRIGGKNDLTSTFAKLLGYQRDALAKLGRNAEAQEVSAAIEAHLGGQSAPADIHASGNAMREAARAEYEKIGSLPEAERAAALEKVEAQRSKAHVLLEKAVAKEPENLDFRESLAASWRLKGRIEKASGRKNEAMAAFEKSIAIYDTAKQANLAADAHYEAGEALKDFKDYAVAVAHLKIAVEQRDKRCAQTSPEPSANDFSRAAQPWVHLSSAQFYLNDLDGSLVSLREAAKRRQRAHDVEPTNRGYHWDLIQTQLETVLRLASCKQAVPAMETAVPALKDLPSLLKDETNQGRLLGFGKYPLSPLSSLLRDQKRLPEAAQVLRYIIALRERSEALGGLTEFSNSSISAHISLAVVLDEQKLTEQSADELRAAIADAERTSKPAILADAHLAIRASYDTRGRHEDAERHARAAYEIAQKQDLGWRGIRIATELASTLIKLRRGSEAESIGLAAWQKAAAQKWPDEPPRLRADIALRLCEAYHNLHMDKPDAARDSAAHIWVQRAAEHAPLDQQKTEIDFNSAILHWMAWLAQLADQGRTEEFKQQRTAVLKAARGFTTLNILERIAKATLVLPAEGEELKLASDGAAAAFRRNPEDEWLRLGQCLALLRTGKGQECLDTAQPMLKTGDTPRWCCIQAVVAVAHRQLGHDAEADAILAGIEKDGGRSKHLSSPTHRDAIFARVLLKQARK